MVERPIGPGPASPLVLGGGPQASLEGVLAAAAQWKRVLADKDVAALADAEDAALAGSRMRGPSAGPSARAASVSKALTSQFMAGPTTAVEARRLLLSPATLKMWRLARPLHPRRPMTRNTTPLLVSKRNQLA